MSVDGSSYLIDGKEVGLGTTAGRRLNAVGGLYDISGADINLFLGSHIDLEPGIYELSGRGIDFRVTKILSIDSGVYVISGTEILARTEIVRLFSSLGKDVTLTSSLGKELNLVSSIITEDI